MCRGTLRRPRRVTALPLNDAASTKTILKQPSAKTVANQSRHSSVSSVRDDKHCPVTGYFSEICDDYYILPRVLGSGHYGSVRECINRKDHQCYAVKTIEKKKIDRLDHLRREVYLLSKINHKNIITMVDCYEDEEHLHVVTEKYNGGELFDKIIENTTNDGCFSEVESARIIKSIIEAVVYLHANEIVHRDIKPENILFESKDERSPIKLIDFGLARRHRRGEALMSTQVGTCFYMSPELLKGKYDKSCDVWSIGVVAYILICGYPPFNGETDPDIFEAIKKGSFSFPSKGWSGISDECKDFIKCLLRKDPRKRFTADEALMHSWLKYSCIFGNKEELLARISMLTTGINNVRVHR
ncbi:hypothetical protein ACHAW6_002400 [Cyclotella cf. meneghiniana]